jgi:putative serine protease PepD
MASVSDNQPGQPERDADSRPEHDTDDPSESPSESNLDDTAPLWSREPEEPAAYDEAGGRPAGSEGEQAVSHDQWHDEQTAPQQEWVGYGYPQPDAYGYQQPGWAEQTQQMPYQGWYQQPHRPSGPRLPGWVWPVVAATALVVGLVGGTVGGALVSSSMNGGSQGGPVFQS